MRLSDRLLGNGIANLNIESGSIENRSLNF